ncbi:glucose dehydrogenase [FAD, quinone]-like [Musca autumnalis]|uniref:glucose dehydrogenase [FAD, quinone]-like n=1 Tax=Musca autumnalis TaxID=221902 RepID=UPI003CFA48A4
MLSSTIDSIARQCPVPSVGAMNTLVTLLIESLYAANCGISRPEEYPPDYGQDILLKNERLKFDFVIVGAGTAGSVVASRLSENPKWSVLVLEAGGNPSPDSEVPPLFVAFGNLQNIYKFHGEANNISCKAFENETCSWIQGKGLGGSDSVNGLLYISGFTHDFDEWLRLGNTRWGYKDILQYTEKNGKRQSNTSQPAKGFMDVGIFEPGDDDIIEIISKAAEELGQLRSNHFEGLDNLGYAIVQGAVRKGRRTGVAKGYLGRVAATRKNLKIIKNAQVTRLRFDSRHQQVTSVDFVLTHQKKNLNVKVKREAILSAGVFHTPQLLMLSGIGPKHILDSVNIPISHNLPVGENLQDHLVVLVFFKIPQEIEANPVQNMIYDYLIHNRGPLTTLGATRLVGFVKSQANMSFADLKIHHMLFKAGNVLSLNIFLSGLAMKLEHKNFISNIVKNHTLLIMAPTLVQPKSKGSIRLKSKSYKESPIIKPNFLLHPEDRVGFVRALKYLAQFEMTEVFQENHVEIVHIPLEEFRIGTESNASTVVSPRLKVKGIRNLRVADASIMPIISSVTTNAPTVIIGEKAADMIKEDWKHVEN